MLGPPRFDQQSCSIPISLNANQPFGCQIGNPRSELPSVLAKIANRYPSTTSTANNGDVEADRDAIKLGQSVR